MGGAEPDEEPDAPPPFVDEPPWDAEPDPPLDDVESELDPPLLPVDAVLECSGDGAPIVKLQAGVTITITLIRVTPQNFHNITRRMPPPNTT
jgi:hypothetical protein